MKQKLRKLLDELQGELAGADSLDEQSKDELRSLADEIDAAVGDDDSDNPADALERLQNAALEFESEYPRLAGILGNIADTLAKIGI